MITIDEVDTEVVVDGPGDTGATGEPDPQLERERLRDVVAELVREELRRFLRTEVQG